MKYKNIKPYVDEGYISEQRHPEENDLAIFNYTQKTQFEGKWDEVTKNCRGLIMRISTGEVVARPFPKFFNYQEHVAKGWPIPKGKPVVMEKLDGSLGILYRLNGKPWIATRGSFVSEQAQWATKWWRENVDVGHLWKEGYTHLYEIIYPENRIVVNYDFSGLVHLATLETETGDAVDYLQPPVIREAKKFESLSIEQLLKMDGENEEGFVLYYPVENVRMKVKFPEYVRLHKLITGVSEISIWEHMKEGNDLEDLLSKVPDEFFQWVRKVQEKITFSFANIEMENEEKFDIIDVILRTALEREPTRKEYALAIAKILPDPAIGFALLDRKDPAPIIWKMVRPRGQSLFKVDIDA